MIRTSRAMGRICPESPGLKEVVISFFPGASSPPNYVHLYKDKPMEQGRQNKQFFLIWFLLGISFAGMWLIVSSRMGHVFGNFQENHNPSKPVPVTFSEDLKTESVLSTPTEDRVSSSSTTPQPDFVGATIGQHGELLMSHLEKQLRVTFSFDDDYETFLESVDIF